MNERNQIFALGLFIIAAIAIVAWLLLFLKPTAGNGELFLHVRFTNIEKIAKGTRVTFAGKPVGEVDRIREIAHPRQGESDDDGNLYIYELLLQVDSSVKIYTYDEILFSSAGLLGEKSIAIIPKATPPGALPAQNVTEEILFGRSMDQLEDTLNQLARVANTFEETLENVNEFIDNNGEEIKNTFNSITAAADGIKIFVAKANEMNTIEKATKAFSSFQTAMDKTDRLFTQVLDRNLIQKMETSLTSIHRVTERIESGEGTLGKLVYSDTLYLQMNTLMAKFERVLSYISNYGLLFQYNKSWQRSELAKINRMQRMCTPCDFYNSFGSEVDEIGASLCRVGQILETAQCRQIPLEDPCFSSAFRSLLDKVENLQQSLNLYAEMLLHHYCQSRCP